MAVSIMNVLSGIGAAVTGLSGGKVSKTGAIPGFDLATILPALLGNKTGGSGAGNLVGTLVSAASKSGLVKTPNLLDLAGSLFSFGKTAEPEKKTTAGSLAGLASAVLGGSGAAEKKTTAGGLAGLASAVLGGSGAASGTSGGIAGLASAIMGNSGNGTDLMSIASMASGLAKTAGDSKGGLTDIASQLGKALGGSSGLNFSGGATALKALDGVMGGDVKGELFKAVLKGLT
jgi:hypothetical protein